MFGSQPEFVPRNLCYFHYVMFLYRSHVLDHLNKFDILKQTNFSNLGLRNYNFNMDILNI